MQNNNHFSEQERQIELVKANAALAEYFRHRTSFGELVEEFAKAEAEVLFMAQSGEADLSSIVASFLEFNRILNLIKPYAKLESKL